MKAVIINDADEALFFSGGLPGGGVENGEELEEALRREVMEEVGGKITNIRDLGNVIAYRDELRKRYIFTGYQCALLSLAIPTTTIDHEIGRTLSWERRIDAIARIKKEIAEVIAAGKTVYTGDRYQRHIFNAKATLLFLEAIH